VVEPLEIVGQRHQGPFSAHVAQAPQAEPIKTQDRFDDPEDRFDGWFAVIALSPDSEFQVSHLPLVQTAEVRAVTLATVAACTDPTNPALPPSGTDYVFGLSAAYAPVGQAQPGRVRWLYNVAGQFQADVWQKWLDNDPLLIVRANVNAFASVLHLISESISMARQMMNWAPTSVRATSSKHSACVPLRLLSMSRLAATAITFGAG
jgi:hypothetical protein